MLKLILDKVKESALSVIPVALIVLIMSPFIGLQLNEILIFFVCSILLIIGIGFFNLGADIAMQPMGEQVGSSLMKTKKMPIIILVIFVMGLLITIAEPDLTVLANQVKDAITPITLIISIGIGVGLFLVLGLFKIIFKKDISLMLMFFYMVLFSLTSLVILSGNESFLSMGFDSGGVTTGPITVPFIMALGVGIAQTVGGRNANENSFGLISLCSIGPIIAIMILGIGMNGDISYTDPNYQIGNNFFLEFLNSLLPIMKEVGIAVGLIVLFFIIIQAIYIKLPKKKLLKIGIGIVYTFIGLVIFLTAANIGFLPIGYKMGKLLANMSPTIVIIFGFVLGLVVVLAEPAIHVLTKQVEEITNGGVTKKSMLIALSIGVGLAICLAMIRIVFNFSILYYVFPGYILSLALSFFVPKMYTAIAFDSGGVASGPLTSTFILPFAIGVCLTLQGEEGVLSNAFGVVALVAMIPPISIQLLGFKSIVTKKVKEHKMMESILSSDDEQIINFM